MSLTNSAKRVRSSHCRRKGPAACRGTKGCKYSKGKKRSFCRKTKNTKRHTMHRRSKRRAMRKQKGGMLDKLMNTMKAMVTPSQTTAGNKVTVSNTGNKPSGNKPTDNKPAGGNKAPPHTNNKSPPHAGNGNKSQKGGRRTHKNKKH